MIKHRLSYIDREKVVTEVRTLPKLESQKEIDKVLLSNDHNDSLTGVKKSQCLIMFPQPVHVY